MPTARTAAAWALAALVAVSSGAASAAEDEPPMALGAIGWYDINDDQGAASLRGEWRGPKMLGPFKPLLGLMATTDGAFYAFGGIALDVYFGSRVVATPNFAIGAYADGDGKDLGSVLEFRSGVELAYRLDNRARLGVGFYHISNAGIGDINPGTEILSVFYAMPLR